MVGDPSASAERPIKFELVINLKTAKWELTSRIGDESNVPNAFHFSRRSPVCAENLDPAVLVMKTAENRSRCDGAEALNRPMDRRVLVQSAMSPRFIIVGGKLAKDSA
jgi:hypothetical protein